MEKLSETALGTEQQESEEESHGQCLENLEPEAMIDVRTDHIPAATCLGIRRLERGEDEMFVGHGRNAFRQFGRKYSGKMDGRNLPKNL